MGAPGQLGRPGYATVSALLMAAALLAGNLGSLTQAILIVLALMGVAAAGSRRCRCSW
jgi:hypothetical protein